VQGVNIYIQLLKASSLNADTNADADADADADAGADANVNVSVTIHCSFLPYILAC
jgi:hypothetical protein